MSNVLRLNLPPLCTGNGTGSAPRLSCGHRGASWPTRASCASGLNPDYEPVQCPAGNWHARRKEPT